MKYSFNEQLSQAEKEFGLSSSGEWFKIREGDNKIRILSPSVPVQSFFKGAPNTKFVTYVLDRADGKIKLTRLPVKVIRGIAALQVNEEYHFDDLPMPYDITIKATGAGTKEVDYQVIGAQTSTPLTAEELKEFESKKPIDEIVKRLREKEAAIPSPSDYRPGEDDPLPTEDVP